MVFVYFLLITLTLQDDPVHTALLYGNSDLGYYYVNIYVGTPPQKQSLIVDTASHITTFPCISCKSCGQHEDRHFNYTASDSMRVVDCNSPLGLTRCEQCNRNGQCQFNIHYAEGSQLAGYYMQDQVLFGDELMEIFKKQEQSPIVQMEETYSVFGCTTLETNLFYTQLANGIMGLAPQTNTSTVLPNIVDSLYQQEKNIGLANMFTLCIGRLNGYMAIGRYDTSRHFMDSQIHTIKYYRNPSGGFYGINIKSINVDNKTIITNEVCQKGQGSFIDSGSTLMNVHPEIAKSFENAFYCNNTMMKCSQQQRVEGMLCYRQNINQSFESFASQFPTYSFELENNFTMNWSPLDYLTKNLMQQDLFCLPVNAFVGQSRLILGQVWMRNWDIAFNKEKEELSFVRSNCSNNKISHHFTEEELTQLEIQLKSENYNRSKPQPRYIPVNHAKELWTEIIYIFIAIIIVGMIILIVIIKKSKPFTSVLEMPQFQDLELQEEIENQGLTESEANIESIENHIV